MRKKDFDLITVVATAFDIFKEFGWKSKIEKRSADDLSTSERVLKKVSEEEVPSDESIKKAELMIDWVRAYETLNPFYEKIKYACQKNVIAKRDIGITAYLPVLFNRMLNP